MRDRRDEVHVLRADPGERRWEVRRMEGKSSRLKRVCLFCMALCVFGIFGFGYFCPDKVCALTTKEGVLIDERDRPAERRGPKVGLGYDDMLNDNFSFDMDSHDVMVFLHMQKTGGTAFGKHLVHDLDLKRPCTCPVTRKRCYCFRPHSNQSWLFSRYTTGWKCGLHADWTELTNCVDEKLDETEVAVRRRYFYVTLLREPIARYLSEFRHVQRGATWKGSRHFCKGRPATEDEIPTCYEGDNWKGVTIEEFVECDSNLAVNRQTRMLADLELIGCYNKSSMSSQERDAVMLSSAKKNLRQMAFFGLTEHQKISQYIFEETFNMRFAVPFEQNNSTLSSSTLTQLTAGQSARIARLNRLDVELYRFARRLLLDRFDRLKSRDTDFAERFAHLGELGQAARRGGAVGPTDFDWDKLEDPTEATR